MNILCKHWKNVGMNGGGKCAINAYGENKTVSLGVCLKLCDQYDGPDRAPLIDQLDVMHANNGETNKKPRSALQLAAEFTEAHRQLLIQGRVPNHVADHRLTICTGVDKDGGLVNDPCPNYRAGKGDKRGDGRCGLCSCPKWPFSQMRRKVWYPVPICPANLFPNAQGRRGMKAKHPSKVLAGVAD